MTALGYGILAAAIVLCAAAVWCERRKTRRTLEKLNEMLTDAMRGDFTEDSFDETLLSALESKLAHYLAASTVSARNVSTEKEKLKTLIGDISHQTKTPIANILLYAQLLREQPGNTVCLDALDAQTKKLQSLIEALVKTSRLESGVIALRPEPEALQDVLSSAVSQLEPKAREKGISITFLPTDAEAVFDAKWTEEAVFNLLDNALEAAAQTEPGEIFCSLQIRQQYLAIRCENTYWGPLRTDSGGVLLTTKDSPNDHGFGLIKMRAVAEKYGSVLDITHADGRFTVLTALKI